MCRWLPKSRWASAGAAWRRWSEAAGQRATGDRPCQGWDPRRRGPVTAAASLSGTPAAQLCSRAEQHRGGAAGRRRLENRNESRGTTSLRPVPWPPACHALVRCPPPCWLDTPARCLLCTLECNGTAGRVPGRDGCCAAQRAFWTAGVLGDTQVHAWRSQVHGGMGWLQGSPGGVRGVMWQLVQTLNNPHLVPPLTRRQLICNCGKAHCMDLHLPWDWLVCVQRLQGLLIR